MVLEGIPSPIALLFGAYIIGSGYLALISLIKEGFKMEAFDKFMYALTFGTLAFSLSITLFKPNIDFSDSSSIVSFLISSPIIFFLNVMFAILLIKIWIWFDKKILNAT